MMLVNKHFIRLAFIIATGVATLIQGCGGSGPETTQKEDPRTQTKADYLGPVPANGEIQAFKLQLWDNLSANNRCGSCHGAGQEPQFVRNDDINLAYEAAMGRSTSGSHYVNLSSPSDSLMVTKVEGGHHCWEESNQVCADTIALFIQRWAGDRAGGNSKTIELSAPISKDPGSSRNFPESSALFSTELHPLLIQYCAGCHAENAPNTPQSPYFAEEDPETAYRAAQSKMDLDNPPNSRFVVRLAVDNHRCWSNNCSNDANELQQAITAIANQIPLTEIDSSLVTSKGLSMMDGIVANSGGRFESNIIALYEFKTGDGKKVYDTSGISPFLHLTLEGDYEWVGGWGVKFNNGKAQGSTTNSNKLIDLITATGEYSFEAWVVPGNVAQEESYIISYSAGTTNRNFTLSQRQYNYEFLHRSSTTDANGNPALSTPDADEVLQAALQHVVATVSPEGRQLYVNGKLIEVDDPVPAGNLNDWDNSYALVLGNEVSNDRVWQGTFRMVAIHNRALTPAQIKQNFDVGVGQKYYLLFGISDWVNIPDSYIVFEVSQFDNGSYLFNEPFYASLNESATPDGLIIKGMRIGINGRESSIGQGYSNLDITLSHGAYQTEQRQVLSTLGTIIPLEKGPESDEFFLTFEQLGDYENVFVEAEPITPADPPDAPPSPAIGIRTFDEINATLSSVTGVDIKNSHVDERFQLVKQQLPTTEAVNGFLSAQQVAIAQLAIEYCNQLVDTPDLRSTFFDTSAFDFNARSDEAFDTSPKRNAITNALLDRIMGEALSIQPQKTTVQTELNALIDILDECSNCTNTEYIERTSKVVKGTCAAVLGSAVMLIQ